MGLQRIHIEPLEVTPMLSYMQVIHFLALSLLILAVFAMSTLNIQQQGKVSC